MARNVAPKQTARIENWNIIRTPSGTFALTGTVFDHPRQAEFSGPVQTSRIVLFDPDNNVAETLNTRYTLGAEGVIDVAELIASRTGVME